MNQRCVDKFWALIRISIGQSESYSFDANEDEWKELFRMAKEQAVLGVCFAGVQYLKRQNKDCFRNIPAQLYMKWLATAAMVQKRNELMDSRCKELQKLVSDNGFRSYVLKGQGVAMLYGRNDALAVQSLSSLRQSGDIDIFVSGGFDDVTSMAKRLAPLGKFSYVHADWKIFKDVEVELHYRPSSLRNLIANARFQKWAESALEKDCVEVNGIVTPSIEFNRVYLLLHCYRHVIGAGIGIRQFMDYYFCLRYKMINREERNEVEQRLKSFGLYRFAGAVMYVMQSVFSLPDEYLICRPNKREGEYLLKQTMIGGNFGRYDKRVANDGSAVKSVARKIFMNLRYLLHYPQELLWAPASRVYAGVWKYRHQKTYLSRQ